MVQSFVALVFVGLLVIGPLAWSAWMTRREARALGVRAEIHAAVARALGGESFVAVRVVAPTPWSEGRVFLSAPAGCESLVTAVWESVAAKLPRDYDLIVQPSDRRVPAPSVAPLAWGHAA